MSSVYGYKGIYPRLGNDVFLAPGSRVIGDVQLGDGVNIWYNTVLRGDVSPVFIGKNSNVQDNCTIHTASALIGDKDIPTIVGENVTIGHNCVLHACTVEDGCLSGMGAVILDGAVIGRGSIVGAGALVLMNTVIEPFSLVVGSPAKVVRTLPQESFAQRLSHAEHYMRLAQENQRGILETPK
jgi:carbonic anhydrase/acetyltransferase-like protein (isoleucine patch superfamily)